MPFSVHNVTNDGFGRKYYDFDLRRVVSFVSASAIRLLVKLGLIDDLTVLERLSTYGSECCEFSRQWAHPACCDKPRRKLPVWKLSRRTLSTSEVADTEDEARFPEKVYEVETPTNIAPNQRS